MYLAAVRRIGEGGAGRQVRRPMRLAGWTSGQAWGGPDGKKAGGGWNPSLWEHAAQSLWPYLLKNLPCRIIWKPYFLFHAKHCQREQRQVHPEREPAGLARTRLMAFQTSGPGRRPRSPAPALAPASLEWGPASFFLLGDLPSRKSPARDSDPTPHKPWTAQPS